MKRFLLALLALGLACAMAQPVESNARLWLGGSVGWTQVAKENTATGSLRGAWMPVPQVSLGAWGTTVLSNVSHRLDTIPQSVNYNAFGILLEPSAYTWSHARILLPVQAGLGFINVTAPGYKDARSAGWFTIMEAGITGEMDINESFRAGLGAGIRVARNVATRGLVNQDLHAFHVDLTLRWGSFEE